METTRTNDPIPSKNVYVGQVFNDLTVIQQLPAKNTHKRFVVKCKCGETYEIYIQHLRKGKNLCHHHKKKKEFLNHSKSETYSSYLNMKDRVTNPNNPDYHHYGNRGITIDPRWLESFESFLNDMGERPKNTTLDRIDPNGNYEKANCRWVNLHIQNQNRRSKSLINLQSIFLPPANPK